jgi:membrane protein implicated in regulation of membrane protease activity
MWAYLMIAMAGAVPAIVLVLVPMVASGGHFLLSLVPAVVIGLIVDAILAMLIACPVALVGRAISSARKRGRVYRWPRRERDRSPVSSRGG